LVGKPEGRRTLGRPRCRWEDDIKMDLRDWVGGTDWIDVAQDRDMAGSWKCCNESSVSIKCEGLLQYLRTVIFSGKTPLDAVSTEDENDCE
jgi:hypothetical protein